MFLDGELLCLSLSKTKSCHAMIILIFPSGAPTTFSLSSNVRVYFSYCYSKLINFDSSWN